MSIFIPFLLSAVIVIADQLIKTWARNSLASVGSFWVVQDVLKLTYVENRGAAFGILRGQRNVLTVMVSIVVIGAVYMILSKKITEPVMVWSVCGIIGGGMGNLIDRIIFGYVVDYIDINPLFSYPMFNLADCCVVSSTIVLSIYLIFFEGRNQSAKVNVEVNAQENDMVSTLEIEKENADENGPEE